MKRLRIAQVSAVYPPYVGGIGTIAAQYAEVLTQLGNEVVTYTPRYRFVQTDAIPSVRYLSPLLSIGLGAITPQLLWKLRGYDVVQLHYPAYGMVVFVLLWKVIFGRSTKLVTLYHMDTKAAGFRALIMFLYRLLLFPLVVRLSDKVIVATNEYAQASHLGRFLPAIRSKISIIPFGVASVFAPASEHAMASVRRNFGLDSQAKIILFVGGLRREHYFKGVDLLIKACSQLKIDPLWQLVLVGAGDWAQQLAALAKKLGIAERVTITGWQSEQALVSWYTTASVTVLPSIDSSEAFGIVLIESMACGTPVICTALPGVREVVQTAGAGVVVPVSDISSLTSAITTVLTNQQLQRQYAKAGRNAVQSFFNWGVIGKQLQTLYQETN